MKKAWITLSLLLVACLTVVALAADLTLYTWDTDYDSGNWDDPTRWISTGSGYPDDNTDWAVIQGKNFNPREIHLVTVCINSLTLSKKIDFDSTDEDGNTLSIQGGGLTINSTSNRDAVIVLTDDAVIETVGTCP